MNEHIEHQIIYADGKPAFAVIPYSEYLLQFAKPIVERDGGTYPHEVIKKIHLENKTPVRAWREYLGKTQKNMAESLNITQTGYSQIEKAESPHSSTLDKIAKIFDIEVELLK